MLLRAIITPVGAVILIAFLIIGIFCFIWVVKARAKMVQEGKIIHREKGFWEYAEIFSVKTVTLEAVYNRFKTILPEKRMIHELQPDKNRIVFNYNGYDDSFKGTIRLISSEDGINTYNLTVHEWSTKGGADPNETVLNLLYTAVEKTFLGFDPNIKVKTEYVDRTTKRSFL